MVWHSKWALWAHSFAAWHAQRLGEICRGQVADASALTAIVRQPFTPALSAAAG